LHLKYEPPIENIPALLIRTCKGPIRAFHASANLATESNERRSSSITFKSHGIMSAIAIQLASLIKVIIYSRKKHIIAGTSRIKKTNYKSN
jgi:hypothetical protein